MDKPDINNLVPQTTVAEICIWYIQVELNSGIVFTKLEGSCYSRFPSCQGGGGATHLLGGCPTQGFWQ